MVASQRLPDSFWPSLASPSHIPTAPDFLFSLAEIVLPSAAYGQAAALGVPVKSFIL